MEMVNRTEHSELTVRTSAGEWERKSECIESLVAPQKGAPALLIPFHSVVMSLFCFRERANVSVIPTLRK